MTNHVAPPPTPARPRRMPRRARRFSARPFYLSLLVICALCALSLVPGRHRATPVGGHALVTRDADDPSGLSKKDCHLVHHAADKCAFVRAHCPDEEAGLFSYLELYYCKLPHAQPAAFTMIVLWLALLFSTIGIAASDFFCVNLSTIASLLGMSESLAGVTFLAFGNGSPDVFSTFAAMSTNSGSLAIGELIGAAGFITAVVAGSMALVRPFKVARKSFVRDVGFFIVAAALSLVFLLDGQLNVWESAAMVLFYIFYVIFVFCWHWWIGKKRRRRQAEALARDHFGGAGTDIAPIEPYHDEEDLPTARPAHSRTTTATDLAALERLNAEWSEDINDDDAEEDRERWMGEISSNMRVNRPRLGERRTTMRNPIRPSLVGALEFRAVLAGLQKSRNIQTIPISLRRYSDDPTFTTAQQHDQLSTISDPPGRPAYEVIAEYGAHPHPDRQYLDVKAATGTRARAVSANDAEALQLDPNVFRPKLTPEGLLTPSNRDSSSARPRSLQEQESGGPSTPPVKLSITPPPSNPNSRPASLAVHTPADASPQFLAPPGTQHETAVSHGTVPHRREDGSRPEVPKLSLPPGRSESSMSSPTSAFPPYTDDPSFITPRSRASSIRLPAPGMSRGSLDLQTHLAQFEQPPKPWKWWPYQVLPSPEVLFSTLFPTLYDWGNKNIWERCLGIVSFPSIFLLTITLPVVESDTKVEEDYHIPTLSLPPSASFVKDHASPRRSNTITILEPDSPAISDPSQNLDIDDGHGDPATALKGLGGHGTTATVATVAEEYHHHAQHAERLAPHERLPLLSPGQPRHLDSPEQLPSLSATEADAPAEKDWNRWLLLIQCFTAPSFTILIVYANFLADDYGAYLLFKMILWALVASLVLLAVVLVTSTPARAPWWRTFLCFAGFVVSIAWISTIANEVVGVLKWLGVVLNMSDAILGLTIFAVGNSLGDLVADITVARLGYPVMALSACFGGPMLNILLGIGLSGLYMTIRGAKHRSEKHPGREWQFRPFRVDVSGTLWISGASLMVTLCALLVAVPARRWRMDRVVGTGLVILWVASTTVNVVVEVLGLSDDIG